MKILKSIIFIKKSKIQCKVKLNWGFLPFSSQGPWVEAFSDVYVAIISFHAMVRTAIYLLILSLHSQSGIWGICSLQQCEENCTDCGPVPRSCDFIPSCAIGQRTRKKNFSLETIQYLNTKTPWGSNCLLYTSMSSSAEYLILLSLSLEWWDPPLLRQSSFYHLYLPYLKKSSVEMRF